ncbi:uncharacterized protein LOC5515742 [Nematostella vectensis]|uniref:uncharacterized protein LOC5515742 n=1 Tax=Nematostella vectensis TaxID=45351 RepID=UPI002077797B|nr:uncharacterized protein LOC5515742 [Nematostella vectensis]
MAGYLRSKKVLCLLVIVGVILYLGTDYLTSYQTRQQELHGAGEYDHESESSYTLTSKRSANHDTTPGLASQGVNAGSFLEDDNSQRETSSANSTVNINETQIKRETLERQKTTENTEELPVSTETPLDVTSFKPHHASREKLQSINDRRIPDQSQERPSWVDEWFTSTTAKPEVERRDSDVNDETEGDVVTRTTHLEHENTIPRTTHHEHENTIPRTTHHEHENTIPRTTHHEHENTIPRRAKGVGIARDEKHSIANNTRRRDRVFHKSHATIDVLPPFSICPYLGLRSPLQKDMDGKEYGNASNENCKPQERQERACKEAYIAYKVDEPALDCDGSPMALCDVASSGTIRCDVSPCGGNPVFVIGVDPKYGILEGRDKWRSVKKAKHLELFLKDYIKSSTQNGFNFCYLRCKSRKVEQLLMFPPLIAAREAHPGEASLFNVNIIMLDSVSRAHFYRSLPSTVAMLRGIRQDTTLDTTVLDFELFQGMADFTFHNIRAFMTGRTDKLYKAHKEQHYHIEYLYSKLKAMGYYTLLQEDSCWFDEWGSLFTDNLFQGNRPRTSAEYKSRWSRFYNKVTRYNIDDFGLSHFSCEALQRYNITNQFNKPKRICFGKKIFGEYFIEYVEALFRKSTNHPIFAYTHLNTGHEVSGTRIKQIDKRLASFIRKMAEEENTMTIMFSDHGPKTTSYAFQTMEGRAEIYDSLLFVVVPGKVGRTLGKKRLQAMFANQQRLVTTVDLHNTMVSLGHVATTPVPISREGIFTEIDKNRTCADIPLRRSAVCKCNGWEERFPNNHPPFTWLAELVLGQLNNRIQEEYLKSEDAEAGYGNCQRLIGKSFEKVRRRKVGDKYVVTMDVIVQPEKEIFEAQVEYPVDTEEWEGDSAIGVNCTHTSRISIYRRFERCKDKSVDLTICVCNSKIGQRHSKRNKHWINIYCRKDLLRVITRAKSFGAEVEVTNLHDDCLVMFSRAHAHSTAVFEIANACDNRTYDVVLRGKSKSKAMLSRTLPYSLRVPPLTLHFVLSVYHLSKPYGFKIKASYRAHFL